MMIEIPNAIENYSIMKKNDQIEKAKKRLSNLISILENNPKEVLEAISKLDGSSSPDPVWLPPDQRKVFVEEVSSSISIDSEDLIILMGLLRKKEVENG
jgi:hypothetical protein